MEPPAPPRPTRQPVFIPSPLRLFAALLVLQVLLYSVLRLILIARTYAPALATRSDLAHSLLVGLRFDFATAVVIALPLTALAYIPWTSPNRGPRTRTFFLTLTTALFGLITFTLLAEVEFFREFATRYNQLALRYLIHPKTVGGMIWYDYPVLRYCLAILALTALVHLALRVSLRFAYPSTPPPPPPPPPPLGVRISIELASALLMVAITLIGARGGLQKDPLTWGAAFTGPSEYANQMSGNGLYSLAGAAREMTSRSREAAPWTNKLPLPEARSLARSLILAPTETLLDADHRTMLRAGDSGSFIHLRTADGKPPNVVVVMMESFSGRYVGALGAPRSFTPHFDALAKEGFLFDRILSAGSHTHQGIFATQLSFPNLPGYESLMESSAGNQDFLSLSRIFQSRAYHTFFLYNGDFSWDNMYGFFQKQGVSTFISGADMLAAAKYPDPVWGVSDTDLFARANKEFQAASTRGPFMAAVMTLSNHSPYLVPNIPPDHPTLSDLDPKTRERLLAFQYADYALGQFIDEAKTLPYFKDTLFVFIGDHGTNVTPVFTDVHLLYHHIPLLFYAPGLLTDSGAPFTGIDHRTGSQLDVLPSILALLHLTDAPRSAWGRSLFNNTFTDGGLAVFKQTGGGHAVAIAQADTLLILGSAAGHPVLLNYNLGPSPAIHPVSDPALQSRMQRDLQAYLQSALTDLTTQSAGPRPKSN